MALRSSFLSGATGSVLALLLLASVPRIAGMLAGPTSCSSVFCLLGDLVVWFVYAALVLVAAVPLLVVLAWAVLRVLGVPRALPVALAGTATTVLLVVGGHEALPEDVLFSWLWVVAGVAFAAWGGLLGRAGKVQPSAAR